MRPVRRATFLLALALLGWLQPARAQFSAELPPLAAPHAHQRLERARALIDSGQAPAARALLGSMLDETGVDPVEVRFLLGLAHLGAGDPFAAITTFRALLAEHPELHRVRLELARVLFDTGSDESARFHFERLRAVEDLPAAVAANVERFLTALRARRGWSAGLTVAILPDSNVNAGTTLHSVTLYGLPGFVPAEELQQRSGIGLYVNATLARAWQLGPSVSWVGRAALTRRDFRGNRFDDMILRVDTGPRWSSSRDEVGLLGVLSQRWVGNERASDGAGARIEWSRRVARDWHSELALERVDVRWRHYPELDGSITQLTALERWQLDATTTIHAGVQINRELLASRPLSNRHLSVLGGANRDFARGWSLGAQWRYGVTRYDEALAAFDYVDRRDNTHTVSMSIAQRSLQWRGLMPVLYVHFIVNDSTLPLYSYRRALAQIGFSRSF